MRALGLALVLLTLVLAPVAGSPEDTGAGLTAGLKGSKHDFSHEAWTGGDLCIACHSQKSDEPPAQAPLWNPSADFNRTFGDAIQDSDDRRSLPGDGTLVCMRCHDGTMAQDMFGGLAAPAPRNTRHPGLMTTGHGGTNHPVGIEYPQFDLEFRPMNAVLSEGKVPLPEGKVECVSCHDPHNQTGMPDMLVKSNRRSALCLTCHKK